MADDRTCLDCIAQYSHLPVKLCEEHADERRSAETAGSWGCAVKKPAEDLWMAILAAQSKLEEAKECFLDLSEMAFDLVLAEQKRAQEKPE